MSFADQCLNRSKDYIKSSYNDNVLSGIGHFGGLFQLDCKDYEEPVLVTSIDGVGTKLTLAVDFLKNQTIIYEDNAHFNIGVDLVNHCVNDIAVQGAKPLFFTNYFSTTKLHPSVFENLASGMSWACQQVDCPIVSGEIAQMPGFYANGIYDVAGSIVGIVEKSKIICGNQMQCGDSIIGIPSSGLHTNGYSLIRSVLLNNYDLKTNFEEFDEKTLGEVLLEPHKCYYKIITEVLSSFEIRGMAHITGGGIFGNISRIVPKGLTPIIDWEKLWDLVEENNSIFKVIQNRSDPQIDNTTMKETFNLGIGMVFVVYSNCVDGLIHWLKENYNEDAIEIGRIHEKNR